MGFEISLSEDVKSHVHAVVEGMQSGEKQDRLPFKYSLQSSFNRRGALLHVSVRPSLVTLSYPEVCKYFTAIRRQV
jgi:hypothetical protein